MKTWEAIISCCGDHRMEGGRRVYYEAPIVWTKTRHIIRARSEQDAIEQAKRIAATDHPTLNYTSVKLNEVK